MALPLFLLLSAEGVLILAFRAKFLGFFAGMKLGPSLVTGFGAGTTIMGAVLLFAGLT